MKAKYPWGVARYRIEGKEVLAQYIGRQKGFECCVCGKGCNAYTFNIFHTDNIEDIDPDTEQDYETWGYGPTHIDEAVELIEEYALCRINDKEVHIPKKKIELTATQIEAIRTITTNTRYEAIDEVAKILGKPIRQKGTWGATSRKTISIDKNTIAEITFSKGKVTALDYFVHGDEHIRYSTMYF